MLDSMGKSKRRSGPRVKHVPPGREQAPAKPAGSAQRVAHLSAPQVLEQIEHARLARDEAEAELAVLIDHAVDLGIGWPEIAARLRVTRQAVRQHYQRRHRDGVDRRVA
jgi:predicted transcriptional regulator